VNGKSSKQPTCDACAGNGPEYDEIDTTQPVR
jgi:hypothetical protein